ncbi:MAG: hypothetical protein K5751_06825 [Treponemataceae bacterium]|nr:hypothetical protein [Treponemataceae bacterium]
MQCVRSGSCELQKLCQEYGIENEDEFAGAVPNTHVMGSAEQARVHGAALHAP